MNKKGQVDSIIIFFVLVVAVLITSIIVLRLVNSVITPFATQLNNTGLPVGQQASVMVENVHAKFTSVWDWAIILMLMINVLILFVSAFLIDIHPAFLIVYIVAGIFLFIFGNFALYPLQQIWGMVGTSVETSQTPLQQYIINNFQIVMLGIYVLSSILMYAKFRFFSGVGTGGNY